MDLQKMLQTLKPILHPHTYVYITVPADRFYDSNTGTVNAAYRDYLFRSLMHFRETEGVTLIARAPDSASSDNDEAKIRKVAVPEEYPWANEPKGVNGPTEDSNATEPTVSFRCRWIQLEVHSALEAVGLTAAF